MQLVYGIDAILNIKHTVDWKKQKRITQNNIRENSKRVKYTYAVGVKTLVKADHNKAKYDPEFNGPYPIVHVNNNGTLKYRKGAILDIVNIRNVHPYKE